MNGWDFSILYAAGVALWQGRDPYSVPHYFYPLPFTYFLALLTFPGAAAEPVMFLVWGAINLGLLLYTWRRDAWKWLLFFPVLHQFSAGQVELLLWFCERQMRPGWRGALLGAFLTLKPQTALILLPWHLVDWLRHDRRTFFQWLLCTVLLWGVPLLWRPDWLPVWLAGRGETSLVYSASNANGVFTLLRLAGLTPQTPITGFILVLTLLLAGIAAVIVVYGLWQSNPNIAKACLMLGNPFGLFYTQLTLMGTAPWWLLVSVNWAATILTLLTQSFVPSMLTPLAVLFWHWRQARLSQKAAELQPDR